MNIREFTSEEISEINSYVITQIPQTLLPSLFVLSESMDKKIKIFISIHRIIEGAKEFIEKEETKIKIQLFLNEVKDTYDKLYSLQLESNQTDMELKKKNIEKRMTLEVLEKNQLINSFINSFLVFAEKQELLSTNSVAGIKMDDDEGMDLYKKIVEKV